MVELNWTVEAIARWTGGRLFNDLDTPITRVSTDSRRPQAGALFIALAGDKFDGHDYVADAMHNGATAAIVERPISTAVPLPQIVVSSTLGALQILGHHHRQGFAGPLVGITGSSGKTTTRRLVAAILGQRGSTLQPQGNFNNHIGVPLTLLDIAPGHHAAVLELGCNDFGEIALLTQLSEPTIGLVTNVGPAHLEKLGNLYGVAAAKGELFRGLRSNAIAVVNIDDPHVAAMPRSSRQRVTYGTASGAEIRLVERRPSPTGQQRLTLDIRGLPAQIDLPLLGEHNALNATAATATALAAGAELNQVQSGLRDIRPEDGRLALVEGPGRIIIIDDTYNANPASMGAAIKVLAELSGDRQSIAVLGDMLELGTASPAAHTELGECVADLNINRLITVGQRSQAIVQGAIRAGMPSAYCTTAADHRLAAELIRATLTTETVVLIKGSRGMKMEQIIPLLTGGEV